MARSGSRTFPIRSPGRVDPDSAPPIVPGYELAGEVVAIGTEAADLVRWPDEVKALIRPRCSPNLEIAGNPLWASVDRAT